MREACIIAKITADCTGYGWLCPVVMDWIALAWPAGLLSTGVLMSTWQQLTSACQYLVQWPQKHKTRPTINEVKAGRSCYHIFFHPNHCIQTTSATQKHTLIPSLGCRPHTPQAINSSTGMVSNVYFWLQDSKIIKLLYPAQQSKGESVQVLTVWDIKCCRC